MIEFADFGFTYPQAAQPVLRGVNARIRDGDLCLVVGRTGRGKSTFLRAINGLVPWFSGGQMTGDVLVNGRSLRAERPRNLARTVGYVGQAPLDGFVTDRVEDEIAYGMEQLGVDPRAMRKRVEETLDLMGIADLRRRPLLSLSGGQQQRVAIGAVLAAQPRVLVLDEPTSALDPTAAADVLAAITTLVHEVGMTVVLAEHRLERIMHFADSVAWITGSGSVEMGPTAEILELADVTPPLVALARHYGWSPIPLSVRAARRRASEIRLALPAPGPSAGGQAVVHAGLAGRDHGTRAGGGSPGAPERGVELVGLRVAYGQVLAVDDVTISFPAGEVAALMGRNGAGKSSLLWAVQGATASSGTVRVSGVDPRAADARRARELVSLVPQNSSDLLYLPSVAAECGQADRESDAPPGTTRGIFSALVGTVDLSLDPRDLSEGQRLALVLAIQLAARPLAVLLDEPTRGLDYQAKEHLAEVLRGLAREGKSVLVATHDVEFAVRVADRAVVMADAEVVADGPTRVICTSSAAYAPQVAKVFWPAQVTQLRDLPAPVPLP
ncbi:MAG: ABC transporter ATP-binding protein [Candidatus Nanopelagicales bacterium]